MILSVMNFLRYLPSVSGTPNGTSEPYDEESLKCVPNSWWRRRPQHRWVASLQKATLLLLLTDLVVVGLLLRALEPLFTLLRRNDEFFGPRFTLSSLNTSDPWHQAALSNKIPKILHQTTASETIPDKWVQPQQSCREAYSDFEYKLWTDESAREFLSVQYPWFVDIWDSYAYPIQRADSIRYFVLHHYGGVYLDMDTWCKRTFPIHKIESETVPHHALFKSTLPTGVTNDFMITSARHPAYAAAIARLSFFNAITRFWAPLLPYCAVMISAGPMFLTMVLKNYLLEEPALRSQTVAVINTTELAPYISDLESATWHRADAKLFMWIGDRPWTWFGMGTIGLVGGLCIFDLVLMILCKYLLRKVASPTYSIKLAKAL